MFGISVFVWFLLCIVPRTVHRAAAHIGHALWRECIGECVHTAGGADNVGPGAELRMFVLDTRRPSPEVLNRHCPVRVAIWLWLELQDVIVRHVKQRAQVMLAGV